MTRLTLHSRRRLGRCWSRRPSPPGCLPRCPEAATVGSSEGTVSGTEETSLLLGSVRSNTGSPTKMLWLRVLGFPLRALVGQGGLRTDELEEVLSVDQLHGEKPLVAFGDQLVKLDEVVVGNVGESAEFVLEPVEAGRVAPEDGLQRDDLVSVVVMRLKTTPIPPCRGVFVARSGPRRESPECRVRSSCRRMSGDRHTRVHGIRFVRSGRRRASPHPLDHEVNRASRRSGRRRVLAIRVSWNHSLWDRGLPPESARADRSRAVAFSQGDRIGEGEASAEPLDFTQDTARAPSRLN